MKFNEGLINPLENPKKSENQEGKTSVIERARAERLELSKNISSRIQNSIDQFKNIPEPLKKFFSSIANWTAVGHIKMASEAITGKTVAGEELTAAQRTALMTIVATNLMAYGLWIYAAAEKNKTVAEVGAASYATSWGVFLATEGVKTFQNTKALAEKYIDDPEVLELLKSPDEIWQNLHTIV